MITYRLITSEDIPAGLALCRSAGWNQLARDWEAFLHLSPEGCLVAVHEGKVVGTVTTIRYQHCFSWVGMVLVDTASRRQGIGLQLLKEALTILHKEPTIKLDATPAGREVYLKLDFVDEYPLSRMVCLHTAKKGQASKVRPLNKDDLSAVAEFDRAIFGATRQPLLEWMHKGAPHLAFLIEEKNKVRGYCLGRQGYNFTHIGPVIANHPQDAKYLVSAAINNCIDKAVVLDIPYFDPGWKAWLYSMGFTVWALQNNARLSACTGVIKFFMAPWKNNLPYSVRSLDKNWRVAIIGSILERTHRLISTAWITLPVWRKCARAKVNKPVPNPRWLIDP